MIDLQESRRKLAANMETFQTLVNGITPQQAVWQPALGKWSIVMVLAHLVDEERDDFRRRLDYTLHRPGESWPPIDPEGWARDRDYNSRDYREVMSEFRREREISLEWLGSLAEPQWNSTYKHPLGDMTAGDLMVSWIAHDYLHLRQLVKLHFDSLVNENVLFNTRYAGEW